MSAKLQQRGKSETQKQKAQRMQREAEEAKKSGVIHCGDLKNLISHLKTSLQKY